MAQSDSAGGLPAAPAPLATARRHAVLAVALAAAAAAGLLMSDPYAIYLARLCLINIIVVYALNITLGYAGQASISIAAVFAVGAYGSAVATMQYGVPFVLAWPVASLLAGLFGVLAALPTLRLAGAYLAMVSIAFNVVAEQIFIHGGTTTGGPIGLPAIPPIEIAGFSLTDSQALAVIAACSVLAIYCVASFRDSQWGRAAVALRESELAAASLGINTVRLKIALFFASSVMAGLAGGLYAHSVAYISPDIGAILASFVFVLMLILGGAGTLWGPLIGAGLLTLVPHLLSELQKYHLLILGIILLLAVTRMPKGLARPGALLRRRKLSPVQEKQRPAAQTGAVESVLLSPAPGAGSLSAQGISKAFGGVRALSDVSVEITPGMIRGIIGPNGSGKSTLVNVLTGYYTPDAGRVMVGTRDITARPTAEIAQAGIVRTFQTPRLFADLSVQENLMVGGFSRRPGSLAGALLGTAESSAISALAAANAAMLAAAFGLHDALHQKAGDLSQGNQRLLEIARALSASPTILLLDEPAAGLSHEESINLCTVLERLRAGGLGILLIEHHMDVVMRVCDRITVLNRGTLLAEGTPREIRDNAAVQEAYLGSKAAS